MRPIESENPRNGEVVRTVQLYKGEEFGFFQFGGSDVIMIFQKGMVEITAEFGRHYLQGQKIGMRKRSK